MAIQIRVSTELGLITFVLEGTVSEVEFDRVVTPLLGTAEYTLMPLTLLDMTAVVAIDASSEFIRDLARRTRSAVDDKIEGGSRMALVANTALSFGLSRMYETLRDTSPVEVEVFRSVSDAVGWLGLPSDYQMQLKDLG